MGLFFPFHFMCFDVQTLVAIKKHSQTPQRYRSFASWTSLGCQFWMQSNRNDSQICIAYKIQKKKKRIATMVISCEKWNAACTLIQWKWKWKWNLHNYLVLSIIHVSFIRLIRLKTQNLIEICFKSRNQSRSRETSRTAIEYPF